MNRVDFIRIGIRAFCILMVLASLRSSSLSPIFFSLGMAVALLIITEPALKYYEVVLKQKAAALKALQEKQRLEELIKQERLLARRMFFRDDA